MMKSARPTPAPRAGPSGGNAEVVTRLKRIESRVVQLMKHVGMKSDGRAALPEDEPPLKQEN